MTTITFQNVYVTSRGCAVGPLEASGPLKGKFDICFDDLYCNEKSFEKAEQKLLYSAIDATMRKSKVVMKDVDLLCGGDLLNQLLSSHYVARDFTVLFLVCMPHVQPAVHSLDRRLYGWNMGMHNMHWHLQVPMSQRQNDNFVILMNMAFKKKKQLQVR